MFQYAAGLRLAMRHSTELKLDLDNLLNRTPGPMLVFRDYDLGIFSIKPDVANQAEIGRFRAIGGARHMPMLVRISGKLIGRSYYKERYRDFDPRVLELGQHTYLDGYFQNERYFSDIEPEIRRRFHLAIDETQLPDATRRLAEQIRHDRCICLSVRRGDYVTHPQSSKIHGVCSLDYFQRALAELRERSAAGRVMVFGDDPAWCQENFTDPDVFTLVGDEHAGERFATKFWLMTLCRHFVIANSSYAWWAAWLSNSKEKIVARPSRWLNLPECAGVDICPPSWIKVIN